MTILIDSMFPLLCLPTSCFQNVTDMWEIIDLYNFSILSQKAKRISRRKQGNYLEVSLNIHKGSLYFSKRSRHVCTMVFGQNQFIVGRRETPLRNVDILSFIDATEHFMDVLNCRIERIKFKPPLTNDRLIMMIDCLNEMKTEIRAVEIKSATWRIYELFMNRFRKSIEQLCVFESDLESDEIVHTRPNFEIKKFFCSNP
uniref:FBA_2 domain-containing protein n=1 Tax=Caenorhabditis tropicalis TaxID=1561998 RepID=A0A1I7U1D9_9PELO